MIHNQQFGFWKKYSTSLTIVDVISQLKYSQDNNYFTCVILLDLEKAFDTVDHELLLTKLEKYGIRGNIQGLFKSYLSDRKQYVCVNNCCSDYQTITCGVPQGSILGPTLFSLYINDIVNDSNFTTRLFADDTVLMLHEKNLSVLNTKVNSELHKIQLWLSKNKLSLNYSKITYMVIAPKRGTIEKFSVSLDGNELSRCESAKYLGFTIESNLRWNLHTASLCKKLPQSA